MSLSLKSSCCVVSCFWRGVFCLAFVVSGSYVALVRSTLICFHFGVCVVWRVFVDFTCKVLRVTAVCCHVVELCVIFCMLLWFDLSCCAALRSEVRCVCMFYLSFRCDSLRFVSSRVAICRAVLYFMFRCMLLRAGHLVALRCVFVWLVSLWFVLMLRCLVFLLLLSLFAMLHCRQLIFSGDGWKKSRPLAVWPTDIPRPPGFEE